MESFQWAPWFLTDLPSVDEQHHQLVDVINRLGTLLTRSSGYTPQEVEVVFGELADYAAYHFQEEEALMLASQLDARHITYHRQQHAQFLQDVTHLHQGIAFGQQAGGQALLSFLTNWLAFHILGSDQLMASLMKAQAAGISHDEALASYQSSKDPATATLLQAMSQLFNQVSERNRALFELNQTLEARVAERTQALSEANHRLESMAMSDVLTGLPNRRHAMLVLEAEWKKAEETGAALSCMMIDADGFKQINDTYGHDAGDTVLRQLSLCLKRAVRTDDVVCRLGGDEFLVICMRTPLDGALQTAEKMRREVAALRVRAGEGFWNGSVSIGVAARNTAMFTPEALLKSADEGVYMAKRNGRNAVATLCAR